MTTMPSRKEVEKSIDGLRGIAKVLDAPGGWGIAGIMVRGAAEELEQQQAEIERLRAALDLIAGTHGAECGSPRGLAAQTLAGTVRENPSTTERTTNALLNAMAEAAELQRQVDALQRFKDFVHARLDTAGVEKDPPGEHRDAGCRIGQRLDLVLGVSPSCATPDEKSALPAYIPEEPFGWTKLVYTAYDLHPHHVFFYGASAPKEDGWFPVYRRPAIPAVETSERMCPVHGFGSMVCICKVSPNPMPGVEMVTVPPAKRHASWCRAYVTNEREQCECGIA